MPEASSGQGPPNPDIFPGVVSASDPDQGLLVDDGDRLRRS